MATPLESFRPQQLINESRTYEPYAPQQIIRVLVILEATYVNGAAKAVLEFGREAPLLPGAQLDLTVATFERLGTDNRTFVNAVADAGLRLEMIREDGRFDFGIIPQLQSIVRRIAPDIIWTNAVKSHFLVRLGGLHQGRRWVACHHGYTTTDLTTRLYNQLDRWSLRKAKMVLTVCHSFAAKMAGRGVSRKRIRILHLPSLPLRNPSRETVAERRLRCGIGGPISVILCVGRLSKEKGHIDVIRAAALLLSSGYPIALVMVGEGPERPALERLARKLGVEQSVKFVGHQTDLASFYAMADIFVLPSASEGCPNVLLEAAQAGVPLVATAVGGVPELVENERDALLVNRNDPAALAKAVERLLTDEPLAERLAGAARRLQSDRTPFRYCEELNAIFRELLT
jgi:glycosyltransferase involved in cell wall biosynthesis